MTALEAGLPVSAWWQTVPNPPCVLSDCVGHKPGEFALGGAQLCRRHVLTVPEVFTVEVERHQWIPDDGATGLESLVTAQGEVYIDMIGRGAPLSTIEAGQLQKAIGDALALATAANGDSGAA